MGAHLIHGSGALFDPPALLSIQETRLALLPLRPVLLCHHPQLRILLAFPRQQDPLHRVLLPFSWVAGERGDYMEEQSGVPWPGQSYLLVHSHLRPVCLHRDPVSSSQHTPQPILTFSQSFLSRCRGALPCSQPSPVSGTIQSSATQRRNLWVARLSCRLSSR